MAVIVIAKGYRECYPCILSLLEGECKNIDAKILDIFIKLKTKKDEKKSLGAGEPGLPPQISMKKIIFNPIGKKMIHYENSENKLEMEGKRSIEKLSKAFEKFNLTHELMNKKLNEEEKRVSQESTKRGSKVPIMNLSNFGIENTHKRQAK